jgi:hypothetical protein
LTTSIICSKFYTHREWVDRNIIIPGYNSAIFYSAIDGPFNFDDSVLVSTLRISTAYDYPGLRTFAITRLEATQIEAIQRIQIAREFGLESWEGPAYQELCDREGAITQAEARVLGVDAFVEVAKKREEGERRKAGAIIKRSDKAVSEARARLIARERDAEQPYGTLMFFKALTKVAFGQLGTNREVLPI